MTINFPDPLRVMGDVAETLFRGGAEALGLTRTPPGWSSEFFDDVSETSKRTPVTITDTPNCAVAAVPMSGGGTVRVTLRLVRGEVAVLSDAIVIRGGLPLFYTASRAARSNAQTHWRLIRSGLNEYEFRCEGTCGLGDGTRLLHKVAAVAAAYAEACAELG